MQVYVKVHTVYTCACMFSPLLVVYPISASHRMKDMIVMITETATITWYHLFTVAAIVYKLNRANVLSNHRHIIILYKVLSLSTSMHVAIAILL